MFLKYNYGAIFGNFCWTRSLASPLEATRTQTHLVDIHSDFHRGGPNPGDVTSQVKVIFYLDLLHLHVCKCILITEAWKLYDATKLMSVKASFVKA